LACFAAFLNGNECGRKAEGRGAAFAGKRISGWGCIGEKTIHPSAVKAKLFATVHLARVVGSALTAIIVVADGISTSAWCEVVKNLTSGLCLDDTSGSTSNGTQMQQYSCSSSNTNQQFTLTQEQ